MGIIAPWTTWKGVPLCDLHLLLRSPFQRVKLTVNTPICICRRRKGIRRQRTEGEKALRAKPAE